MFWFFGHVTYGILGPLPEVKPAPSALEGEVLTTGPPEKSHPILIEVPFLIYQD